MVNYDRKERLLRRTGTPYIVTRRDVVELYPTKGRYDTCMSGYGSQLVQTALVQVLLDDHRDHGFENLLDLVGIRGTCLVNKDCLLLVLVYNFKFLLDELH